MIGNHEAWAQEIQEIAPELGEALGAVAVIPRTAITTRELVAIYTSAFSDTKATASQLVDRSEHTIKSQLHSLGAKCQTYNAENKLYRVCTESSLYTAYDSGWISAKKDEKWRGTLDIVQSLVLQGLALGLTQKEMVGKFSVSNSTIVRTKDELNEVFDVTGKGRGAVIRRSYETSLFVSRLRPPQKPVQRQQKPAHEHVRLPNSAFTLIHKKDD